MTNSTEKVLIALREEILHTTAAMSNMNPDTTEYQQMAYNLNQLGDTIAKLEKSATDLAIEELKASTETHVASIKSDCDARLEVEKNRLNRNTILLVAGNLVGTVAILTFEAFGTRILPAKALNNLFNTI